MNSSTHEPAAHSQISHQEPIAAIRMIRRYSFSTKSMVIHERTTVEHKLVSLALAALTRPWLRSRFDPVVILANSKFPHTAL